MKQCYTLVFVKYITIFNTLDPKIKSIHNHNYKVYYSYDYKFFNYPITFIHINHKQFNLLLIACPPVKVSIHIMTLNLNMYFACNWHCHPITVTDQK